MTKHKRDIPQGLDRNNLCSIWPRCLCRRTLTHWSKVIAEDQLPTTVHELHDAEVLIYYALECAGEYCPDVAVRRICAMQLRTQYWDRARRDEWLTEEIAEGIRQKWRDRMRPVIVKGPAQ